MVLAFIHCEAYHTIEFALIRRRDDDRCICLASLLALLIVVC